MPVLLKNNKTGNARFTLEAAGKSQKDKEMLTRRVKVNLQRAALSNPGLPPRIFRHMPQLFPISKR
jgi:hypothetical protein